MNEPDATGHLYFFSHAISREEITAVQKQFENVYRIYGDRIARCNLELRPVPKTSLLWTARYVADFVVNGRLGDIMVKFDPDTEIRALCGEISRPSCPNWIGGQRGTENGANIWYGGFQVMSHGAACKLLPHIECGIGGFYQDIDLCRIVDGLGLPFEHFRFVNLWGTDPTEKVRVYHPKKR